MPCYVMFTCKNKTTKPHQNSTVDGPKFDPISLTVVLKKKEKRKELQRNIVCV